MPDRADRTKLIDAPADGSLPPHAEGHADGVVQLTTDPDSLTTRAVYIPAKPPALVSRDDYTPVISPWQAAACTLAGFWLPIVSLPFIGVFLAMRVRRHNRKRMEQVSALPLEPRAQRRLRFSLRWSGRWSRWLTVANIPVFLGIAGFLFGMLWWLSQPYSYLVPRTEAMGIVFSGRGRPWFAIDSQADLDHLQHTLARPEVGGYISPWVHTTYQSTDWQEISEEEFRSAMPGNHFHIDWGEYVTSGIGPYEAIVDTHQEGKTFTGVKGQANGVWMDFRAIDRQDAYILCIWIAVWTGGLVHLLGWVGFMSHRKAETQLAEDHMPYVRGSVAAKTLLWVLIVLASVTPLYLLTFPAIGPWLVRTHHGWEFRHRVEDAAILARQRTG